MIKIKRKKIDVEIKGVHVKGIFTKGQLVKAIAKIIGSNAIAKEQANFVWKGNNEQ